MPNGWSHTEQKPRIVCCKVPFLDKKCILAAVAAELKRKDPSEEKMPEMATIPEVSQGLQDAKVGLFL
jgi:hypothetical protein